MQSIKDVLYCKEGKDNKKAWIKVGVLIVKDNGKTSIKIDTIPVGNWDGWLMVSEDRKDEKDKPFDERPF